MKITTFQGLQSEIYVPITPESLFTLCTKELKDMRIALVSACGAHLKSDKKFNLAGDTTYRVVPDITLTKNLMISHGGYDNTDGNRDINSMFPLDRLHELAAEGFIKECAPKHYTFMSGGGNQAVFQEETGPAIAKLLAKEAVDGAILTAG